MAAKIRHSTLLLLLLVVAFFLPLVCSTEFVHLYFNYTIDPYTKNYADLKRILVRNQPELRVLTSRALAVRRPNFYDLPARVILCHLNGDLPQDKCVVAFADDDISAMGFRNSTGHWHCIGGFRFAGCTVLPFGENYGELLGEGGHVNLPLVPLGREAAKEGVRLLASYSYSPGGDLGPAKRGMARFIVMIAEAARFRPISNRLADHWEEETYMLEVEANFCINWGKMSFLLIDWDKTTGRTSWGRGHYTAAQELERETGIKSQGDVLRVLDLLVRPRSGYTVPN
ncbi:60 kDa jasmonate-induced protein-like [Aegilops tauschii subsp. strangulata]